MRLCFKLVFGLAFGMAALRGAGPERVASVVRADPRTGRLVRVLVTSSSNRPAVSKRAAATPPAQSGQPAEAPAGGVSQAPAFSQTVERIAAQHELPVALIHSVIKVESNYNPWAVSPKGALGLMQLIPSTARRFGVSDAFDPEENIRGGAKYLRYLLDLYGGDYALTLAAYNAGEAAVARYGDVPPFPETRNYVKLVGARLAAGQPASPVTPAPAAGEPVALAAAGPSHIREIVEGDGSVRYISQ
jgi:soluble lytic murein transglycosylase-like protein